MTGRRVRPWVSLAGVLLATILAGPAGAQSLLQLERTDPAHDKGRHTLPLDPVPIPPHPTLVRPRIVYRFPDGLEALTTADTELSELCRRLAFVQTMDRFFGAFTPGRNYGVAFPTGGSLIDLRNMAVDGKVYFFRDQDSRCDVRVGEIAKLMSYYIRK